MADLNINKSDTSGLHEDVGQNLIINADFENAPSFTAVTNTTNRWVDGTAAGSSALTANGWGIPTAGLTVTADAQFDSSVSHGGSNSMKLETLDATGLITVTSYIGSSPNAVTGIPAYASTAYNFSSWISTNNAATNAVWIDIREFSATFSTLATNSTTKLSGTNGWTNLIKSFTTNASTTFIGIILRISVAGNISQAWFDDISLLATTSNGQVNMPIGVTVTRGIQDKSGPKIWS